MLAKAACEHKPGRWEVNPVELHYTRRCAVCGHILRRLTLDEAINRDVPALRSSVKQAKFNRENGGKA